MRILIFGGTVFLGHALARAAQAAGHDVTCAARGQSGQVPDGVTLVRVDRDHPDGLDALDGMKFDAVIDVARRPSHVRHATTALADRAGHWIFVSSCSAYADQSAPGNTAEAPLLEAAAPGTDETDMSRYCELKVACEQAVTAALGAERTMLARPGLIVGPGDPSNRFDYWVSRLARGGEILAPGAPSDQVQWIDVRDLAGWLVEAANRQLTGAWNTIGAPVSRADFLAGIAEGVGVTPQLTWVDQDFLTECEVEPWMGDRSLPMWLPLPEYAGFMTRDAGPALAAGLSPRPLAQTAADTLAWLPSATDRRSVSGLTAEQEAELLQRWHARATS